MKNNKTVGIIIITLIYLISLASVIGIYYLFPASLKNQVLLTLLILDIIATLIVYIFSCIFKNASIYDPYWSVAPVFLVLAFMILTNNFHPLAIIFLVLVLVWSIRLTLNWAMNFKNLNTQDWRYQGFKDKHPKTFFLINLFGIELFPTIIVFIGLIPGFFFLEKVMKNPGSLNAATIIGFVLMLGATIIELISDIQMYNFRKTNKVHGAIMNKGLWKYSRHPNYFGEILFWVSIWLTFISRENRFEIILVMAACPVSIFLLFQFVSIPMLEKRQLKNKPGYRDYINNTNTLWLYPLLKGNKKEK